ncbi:MAG: hypothetical protein ACRD3T_17065 [Terriglobia bacterium]
MNRLIRGDRNIPSWGWFMAQCPECEAAIDLEDDAVEEGQIVDCPECGVELEVIGTDPLELNAVTDDEEEEEDEEW